MLKFAIIRMVGEKRFRVILEDGDGDLKRELASRVGRILGAKESFTSREINTAINEAFEEYKKEFKERTVKLP